MGLLGVIAGGVLTVDTIFGTGGTGFRRVAPWLSFSPAAIEVGSQAAAALEGGSQAAVAPQSNAGNLVADSIISKSTALSIVVPVPKEQKQ